jgi:hypothetical protein
MQPGKLTKKKLLLFVRLLIFLVVRIPIFVFLGILLLLTVPFLLIRAIFLLLLKVFFKETYWRLMKEQAVEKDVKRLEKKLAATMGECFGKSRSQADDEDWADDEEDEDWADDDEDEDWAGDDEDGDWADEDDWDNALDRPGGSGQQFRQSKKTKQFFPVRPAKTGFPREDDFDREDLRQANLALAAEVFLKAGRTDDVRRAEDSRFDDVYQYYVHQLLVRRRVRPKRLLNPSSAMARKAGGNP